MKVFLPNSISAPISWDSPELTGREVAVVLPPITAESSALSSSAVIISLLLEAGIKTDVPVWIYALGWLGSACG